MNFHWRDFRLQTLIFLVTILITYLLQCAEPIINPSWVFNIIGEYLLSNQRAVNIVIYLIIISSAVIIFSAQNSIRSELSFVRTVRRWLRKKSIFVSCILLLASGILFGHSLYSYIFHKQINISYLFASFIGIYYGILLVLLTHVFTDYFRVEMSQLEWRIKSLIRLLLFILICISLYLLYREFE